MEVDKLNIVIINCEWSHSQFARFMVQQGDLLDKRDKLFNLGSYCHIWTQNRASILRYTSPVSTPVLSQCYTHELVVHQSETYQYTACRLSPTKSSSSSLFMFLRFNFCDLSTSNASLCVSKTSLYTFLGNFTKYLSEHRVSSL